ncbi:MAG: hypothetical protein BAA01_05525 [Bacillus thermozeamaize]|uniref:Manganese transport system membrane protein MntC n=1 Tax=Bacillus thermozeamaize TaxID=230954 RepID=A0A1Y3PMI3_9BACI|nr:MAG: hypothetical protein BAA01_05525 [Bacillus thermozeamaize]
METLFSMFLDKNFQWVMMACVLLGISSGILGCFALLRKYSLMGDAVAHAALPGIAIAFILYGAKSLGVFIIGAAIAGLIGSLCISLITRYSRIKQDAALAIILSVFFGFGTVLLTKIAQSGKGNQAGLDAFLFGKAASLIGSDVQIMAIVTGALILVSFLLFKEMKLLAFDPDFGRGIGLPMTFLEVLLMLMLVLSVVIGLQAVGVVLMSALLIIPAVAARYWTEKLHIMVIIAGTIGACAGFLGTFLSALTPRMPTGPVIVLTAAAMFVISLLFAPNRGLAAKMIRHLQLRYEVSMNHILQTLYELAEHDVVNGHSIRSYTLEQIKKQRPMPERLVKRCLNKLAQRGWIVQTQPGMWTLTPRGIQEAYAVTLEERLAELLLIYAERFGNINPNQNGTRLQDQIPESVLSELWSYLKALNREPKLNP